MMALPAALRGTGVPHSFVSCMGTCPSTALFFAFFSLEDTADDRLPAATRTFAIHFRLTCGFLYFLFFFDGNRDEGISRSKLGRKVEDANGKSVAAGDQYVVAATNMIRAAKRIGVKRYVYE